MMDTQLDLRESIFKKVIQFFVKYGFEKSVRKAIWEMK